MLEARRPSGGACPAYPRCHAGRRVGALQNVAELGNNTAARAEISTLRGSGTALGLLDGRSRTASPGTLTDTIRVDAQHPLLTLVTMIAAPDGPPVGTWHLEKLN